MATEKRRLIKVIFLVVVVVTAFSFGLATLQFRDLSAQRSSVPGDFEFYYFARRVVSTVNMSLLIIVLAIYGGIYRKTHSSFTVGLLIFAAALFVRNTTSNPFIINLFGFRASGLGPFQLIPAIFETVTILALLYLSVKD